MKYEVASKQPVHYTAQQGEQVPQMHQGLENSFISSAFQPKPEQWHTAHPKKGDGTYKDQLQSGPIIEIVCTCLGKKDFHMVVPQLMAISGSQKMWGFELLFFKIFQPKTRELTKYSLQNKIPSAWCLIQGSAEQFVTEDLQEILMLKQWGTSTPGEGTSSATTTSVEVALEQKAKTGPYSLYCWSLHLNISIWLKYYLSRDPYSWKINV